MMQDIYNDGYDAGLKEAALRAERVRDAKTQQGKHAEAKGAEEARVRIQSLINYREEFARGPQDDVFSERKVP